MRLNPYRAAEVFAAEALAKGDPTGWFEQLYQAEQRHQATVPWDHRLPSALLVDWAPSGFGRALVIGCGFGEDAEFLAARGHPVVAFDVAPTAVAVARGRFPQSTVDYRVADLLALPADLEARFDLVVESLTVQSLPPALHPQATAAIRQTVAPGGRLLVLARRRDEHSDHDSNDGAIEPGPPWPLSRAEVDGFAGDGLAIVRIEKIDIRRRPGWRAEFRCVARTSFT